MRRSVSPRAVVLSVLLVMSVLTIQGIVNPLRGVRADTASFVPSSASAAVSGSRTAPTVRDGRVTDARTLVSVALPTGWMPQSQAATDVITLALVGPGSQTLSVGVIDNLADLGAATQTVLDSTRGDASTVTVDTASDATVGAEHANTFTSTAHLPADPGTTVSEARWVVVHQGRTYIVTARGTMSTLTDARSIVASLLFVDNAMVSMSGTSSSPVVPTTTGQVVTNMNTDPVNVRAMPTTESAIVVQLAAGESAMVIETDVPGSESGTTWLRVSVQGKNGYVRADLVSAPRTQAASPLPTATSIPVGSATRATPTAVSVAPSGTASVSTNTTVVPLASSPSPSPASTAPASASATDTTGATTVLSVDFTDLTTPIKAGAMVTAKVKTAPGAMCAIDAQYQASNSKTAGLGDIAADGTGAVSWTWQVGATTTRGSWPIVVTCTSGGQTALGRMYLDVT